MEKKGKWDAILDSPFMKVFELFISIFGLIISFFSDIIWLRIVTIALFSISIICATVYIVKNYFSVRRAKFGFDFQTSERLVRMHQCFHGFRNYTLQVDYSKSEAMDKEKFESILHIICDDIEKSLEDMYDTATPPCVCVKQIKPNSLTSTDFNKWQLETICRSRNTKQIRNNIDTQPVLVEENTDFKIILSGAADSGFFASNNLCKTEEIFRKDHKEFRNSRTDYKEYYLSTVVVPIRASFNLVSPQVKSIYKKTKADYHVFGFLCVDSMETFSDDSARFKSVIEITKCYADTFYPMCEKYFLQQLESTSHSESNGNPVDT